MKFVLVPVIVAVLIGQPVHGNERTKTSDPPDFTKANPLQEDQDVQEWRHWPMGPTGARIWVWANHKTIWSDGATQISVIKVGAGTPASGKLEGGDVILGAAGGTDPKPFVKNARSEVAQAITDAEVAVNQGRLNLLIWRKGSTSTVTLTLPVMGSFSPTSPAHCEKTNLVVDQIATWIVHKGGLKGDVIPACISALGLLSTGDEKYLPAIREFAHRIGPPDMTLELGPPMRSWHLAYTMIFLAEYHAATKDDHVLPALTEIATKMALGRSGVGTWGHTTARRPHGPASGYGCMNAVGVPITIGLVLAQKCGGSRTRRSIPPSRCPRTSCGISSTKDPCPMGITSRTSWHSTTTAAVPWRRFCSTCWARRKRLPISLP